MDKHDIKTNHNIILKVRCVPDDGIEECKKCIFQGDPNGCAAFACTPGTRIDGNHVHFEVVEVYGDLPSLSSTGV